MLPTAHLLGSTIKLTHIAIWICSVRVRQIRQPEVRKIQNLRTIYFCGDLMVPDGASEPVHIWFFRLISVISII